MLQYSVLKPHLGCFKNIILIIVMRLLQTVLLTMRMQITNKIYSASAGNFLVPE